MVPVILRVKPAVLASLLFGERLLEVGAALVTVKSTEFDGPRPGLTTVIGKVPAVTNWAAVTLAVNDVAPPNVVTSDVAPNLTTAPSKKSLPVTVNVNGEDPRTAELGERLVKLATVITEKLKGAEAVSPGLTTVISKFPGVLNSFVVTSAVNEVSLRKVVLRAVLPKLTTAPSTKLLPVSVKVKAGSPTGALVLDSWSNTAGLIIGERLAIDLLEAGLFLKK